ncbi:MAG: histone-lysine N-methyltransferase, partial [Mailhella sp.]|nr:histone-lysine N-methyltransferase [Mailhella sp.]
EIYNIFDTARILNRPVPIIITDKSGRAGVAYWINSNLDLPEERKVTKKHPAVGLIYNDIMQAYEAGRNTSFSNKEMMVLVKHHMPELFISELEKLKRLASRLASGIMSRMALVCHGTHGHVERCEAMQEFADHYPYMQFIQLTDAQGKLVQAVVTDEKHAPKYGNLPDPGYDYSDRQWFKEPMRDGELHVTDVYQSQYTGALILSVSQAVTDENDEIVGVLCGDIQIEELLKHSDDLEAEEKDMAAE